MIGKTLGHYRVGEQLGRGGMGEVYVADDLNLNRKVALKFLPDAFTGDPERMARFEREAKLLASLNHPNIAAIYGLEHAEGKRFIVMELVEGESLSQRLGKGPLPIEEALAVCRQIAEGLEAAHEKGVIHRDLKPANVMITEGDKVKILDFGLAKALSGETQNAAASQSPTITEAMTQAGVILGTAAYMSPEQAKGKTVDKRADIWAFGCILYECLIGKKAFDGEGVTETLASVLKNDPDLNALPANTPPIIRFVLQRCLEKDVSRRFRDAADIRIEIEEAFAVPAAHEKTRARTSRALIVALIALGMAVGWGLAYFWYKSKNTTVATTQATYSYIAAPPEVIFAFHHGFALSPDGQTLIFSARSTDGPQRLWKRRLDNPRAQAVAGTDGGEFPFWSPDGRQVAFFVPGELRRVPAEGGEVQTICKVPGSIRNGSWGENNEILFCQYQASRQAIFRVSADSGIPALVPGLVDDITQPKWLPGGRDFLFLRSKGTLRRIFAASIGGNVSPKLVAEFESGNPGFFFSAPQYLFFNHAGVLSVQRFDVKSLSRIGPIVPISSLAGTPLNWFALTAARDKVAMLASGSPDDTGNPGDPLARLQWRDRRGEIVGDLGPPGRYWSLRLSPSGKRVAVNPDGDISILDPGNRRTRVTSAPEVETCPVWSPDETEIAFLIDGQGVYRKPSIQGGNTTELLRGTMVGFYPTDWSRDGYLLLEALNAKGSETWDIWVYDFNEKSARPWLEGKFDEKQARFSPDGSLVAYTSNANGPDEVRLRLFIGDKDILVSPGGGRHPGWAKNGRDFELFYLSPKDELVVVRVTRFGEELKASEPQILFKVAINDIASGLSPYDVTPDGQRFLVNVLETPEPLLLIQGLEELLKKGR